MHSIIPLPIIAKPDYSYLIIPETPSHNIQATDLLCVTLEYPIERYPELQQQLSEYYGTYDNNYAPKAVPFCAYKINISEVTDILAKALLV